LDPLRSGSATLGIEQIFDVELNKNAQLLPADTGNKISSSVLWSQDRGESDRVIETAQEPTDEIVVKSEPPEDIYSSTEATEDEKLLIDEEPEPSMYLFIWCLSFRLIDILQSTKGLSLC
jgi:hypothetical protein